MKAYYVEGQGHFVCLASNREEARREGIFEWGRGCVVYVRPATRRECLDYKLQRGRLIIAVE